MAKGKPMLYSVYRGDEFIALGTAAELADRFGVNENTVYYWATDKNKSMDNGKRLVAERVEPWEPAMNAEGDSDGR